MKDKKYVYVLSKEIYDLLIAQGNKPISSIGSDGNKVYIFENTKALRLDFTDKTVLNKLRFSNQLKMQF